MKKSKPCRRVLLKLSGEILMGTEKFGINRDACNKVAKSLKNIHEEGIEVAVVMGGGNIFRGLHQSLGAKRTPADNMGMLATIINGLALEQAVSGVGCKTRVMSALECPKAVESYNWNNALRYLSSGEIVIFVGGTGNPYFSTDTAAALRANEIGADVLFKATKVDGVYDKDPLKHPDAEFYHRLTYTQFLAQNLRVMDSTAVALCMNNHVPIYIFNMQLLEKNQFIETLIQNSSGTLITDEKT